MDPEADNPPPRPRGTHPPDQEADPPLPGRDGHCSGWYASYWNAFLLGDGIELCKKAIALILWIYAVLRTSEILLTFKFGIWFCERFRQPSVWNPPDFNLSIITTCSTTET